MICLFASYRSVSNHEVSPTGGWLVGWLVGRLVGRSVSWLVVYLVMLNVQFAPLRSTVCQSVTHSYIFQTDSTVISSIEKYL